MTHRWSVRTVRVSARSSSGQIIGTNLNLAVNLPESMLIGQRAEPESERRPVRFPLDGLIELGSGVRQYWRKRRALMEIEWLPIELCLRDFWFALGVFILRRRRPQRRRSGSATDRTATTTRAPTNPTIIPTDTLLRFAQTWKPSTSARAPTEHCPVCPFCRPTRRRS